MVNCSGNKVTGFIFLGSKITADSDWGHEIKRQLLLGGKAMTNLDCVLKSRDITLPTKVYIIKAMVFTVVMYRVWELSHKEGWVSKNWCFQIVVLEKTPWLARWSNQSILKGINPEYSLKGLMLELKLQYFGHLLGIIDSLKKSLILWKIEGKSRRWWQRWLNGIIH